MNEIWDVRHDDRPNPVVVRLRPLAMLGILGVGLPSPLLIHAGNLVLDVCIVGLAYQVLTDRSLTRREIVPGAAVAGVGCFSVQLLGSWFVQRVVNGATEPYGTFAVVIGLLRWFHLLAQITLLGSEIDVVASRALAREPDRTPPHRRRLHVVPPVRRRGPPARRGRTRVARRSPAPPTSSSPAGGSPSPGVRRVHLRGSVRRSRLVNAPCGGCWRRFDTQAARNRHGGSVHVLGDSIREHHDPGPARCGAELDHRRHRSTCRGRQWSLPARSAPPADEGAERLAFVRSLAEALAACEDVRLLHDLRDQLVELLAPTATR